MLAQRQRRRFLDRRESLLSVARYQVRFSPRQQVGDVGDVVFPCGTTLNPRTNELRMYYGAADTTVALATANLTDVLDWLRSHPS